MKFSIYQVRIYDIYTNISVEIVTDDRLHVLTTGSINEVSYAYIFGHSKKLVVEAKLLIQDLVSVVQENEVFTSEIMDIKDFGLNVKLTRAQEALLHISEITHDTSIIKMNLNEVFKIGQNLDVKV